jgi:hypothetical protein
MAEETCHPGKEMREIIVFQKDSNKAATLWISTTYAKKLKCRER